MDPSIYKSDQAGRVIRTLRGYHAFIPSPPPKLQYDESLVRLLSTADAALSELSGLGRYLPNPHLLIAPYVRREAVLSSRIEGTRTSLNELFQEELQPGMTEQDTQDVREVRNYVTAMSHGIARLAKLPLGLRLVRELHEKLMKGVRGEIATPGEFRRTQNWIGHPGSTLATATYVPPPVEEMADALAAWERFVNERDRMADLIQCAMMHEYFEAIHPFVDGNGRVGRLLIPLFLMERKRLSQPFLYLSAYFEANRAAYYEGLHRVRTEGDWDGWVRYFLDGVGQTAIEGVRRAQSLMDVRERFRKKLLRKPNALRLLDELFVNPYLTAARAARVLRSTPPTARLAIRQLKNAGLVREISGGRWRHLFLAPQIQRIIE